MEYSPIIYCRTYEGPADYRRLVIPEPSFCPKLETEVFIQFMRAVINVDNLRFGDIAEKRWSYFKQGNLVLWGAGLMNHSLENIRQDYFYDFKTRAIRSFIGIIIKVESKERHELMLPTSQDFLTDLFETYIIPRWRETASNTEQIASKPLKKWPGKSIDGSAPPKTQLINIDQSVVKTFPMTNLGEYTVYNLFLEAMHTSSDFLNLVGGLNTDHHGIESGFMNALTRESSEIKKHRSRPYQQQQAERSIQPPDRSKDEPGRYGAAEETKTGFWSLFGSKKKTATDRTPYKKDPPSHTKNRSAADRRNAPNAHLASRLVRVESTPAQPTSPITDSGKTAPPAVEQASPPTHPDTLPPDVDIKTKVLEKLNAVEMAVEDGTLAEDHLYTIDEFLNSYLPPPSSK